RLAKAGTHAGQVLQFENDVFEDMAGVGAVLQALEEAAAFTDAAAMLDQPWQEGDQAFIKSGEFIGGVVFKLADIQPGFDHRAIGPDVRSAQVCHTEKLN